MPLTLAVVVPLVALGFGGAATQSAALPPVQRAPDVPAARRCIDDAAIARAREYAERRRGTVTFAVMERGRVRSFGGGIPMRSASLVKAMLLVAELRGRAAAGHGLTQADRARLHRMITVSDNQAAGATFNLVGQAAMLRLAKAAGMRRYRVHGYWGTSQLTASDQARFWGRINQLLPNRFEAYGRSLLRSIVHAQVWGGAPVTRSHGFRTMFKSGWLPQPGGWLVHQGLRIERGTCTAGIAVLTSHQPSMDAGITSIRGVVERLT